MLDSWASWVLLGWSRAWIPDKSDRKCCFTQDDRFVTFARLGGLWPDSRLPGGVPGVSFGPIPGFRGVPGRLLGPIPGFQASRGGSWARVQASQGVPRVTLDPIPGFPGWCPGPDSRSAPGQATKPATKGGSCCRVPASSGAGRCPSWMDCRSRDSRRARWVVVCTRWYTRVVVYPGPVLPLPYPALLYTAPALPASMKGTLLVCTLPGVSWVPF